MKSDSGNGTSLSLAPATELQKKNTIGVASCLRIQPRDGPHLLAAVSAITGVIAEITGGC